MRFINVRQLTHNLREATKELPVTVTKFGQPIFKIISVIGIGESKVQQDKTSPSKHLNSPKKKHKCEWEPFTCSKEAIDKRDGKWYCYEHLFRKG